VVGVFVGELIAFLLAYFQMMDAFRSQVYDCMGTLLAVEDNSFEKIDDSKGQRKKKERQGCT
jgi:hypothetical protein